MMILIILYKFQQILSIIKQLHSMLGPQKIKTITIHTRKQITLFHQQLKQKMNKAFEQEKEESYKHLLIIIQALYLLSPVPTFLQEINQFGLIKIVSNLETLLKKIRLIKLDIKNQIKHWAILLLAEYQKIYNNVKINEVETYMKQNGAKDSLESLSKYQILNQNFLVVVESNDRKFLEFMIDLLRVHLLFEIQIVKKRHNFKNQFGIWESMLKSLVRSCRIIDNFKLQEIIVTICYYICLKQEKFNEVVIYLGLGSFLIQSLAKESIGQSYGKKIIAFLKHLLLHFTSKEVKGNMIVLEDLESALKNFYFTIDNQNLLASLRNLIQTASKKGFEVKVEQKYQNALENYNNFLKTSDEKTYEKTLQNLFYLNLQSQTAENEQIFSKYFKNFLSNILIQEKNINILRQVWSILGHRFKNGKAYLNSITNIINRVDSTLTDKSYEEILKKDKKKLLINIIKILQNFLKNKEQMNDVIELMKKHKLQKKLAQFSDCTNFKYERQFFIFKKLLQYNNVESQNSEEQQKKLIEILQKSIVQKYRKKKSGKVEDIEEIELLYDLFKKYYNENPSKNPFKIEENFTKALQYRISSNSNHETQGNILLNFDIEDYEKFTKEMNMIVIKFFLELIKKKIYHPFLENQKLYGKVYQLSYLLNNYDELYSLCNQFLSLYDEFFFNKSKLDQQRNQQEEKEQENQEKAEKQQIVEQNNNSKDKKLIQLVKKEKKAKITDNYFQNDYSEMQIRKTNSKQLLDIIAAFLFEAKIINSKFLMKYLKGIYQLTKKNLMRQIVFISQNKKLLNLFLQVVDQNFILQANEENQCFILFDSIFSEFILFHIESYFVEERQIKQKLFQNQVNFYEELLENLDKNITKGFFKQRVRIFQLQIELCQLYSCFSNKKIIQKVTNEERKQQLFISCLNNDIELVGNIFIQILKKRNNQQFEQKFWLKNRQFIVDLIEKEYSNNLIFSFLKKYFCTQNQSQIIQLNLQLYIFTLAEQLLKNIQYLNENSVNQSIFYFRGRKIKLIADICFNFNSLNINQKNKERQLQFQTIFVKCILSITQIIEKATQKNRKQYLQDALKSVFGALNLLYRNNFVDLEIKEAFQVMDKCEELYFLKDQNIKEMLCQLSRILYLKNYEEMEKKSAIKFLKQNQQQISENSKAHIEACQRVQQFKNNEMNKSIKKEFSNYFYGTPLQEEEIIKKGDIQEGDLISYLKNLLNPPYKYGIKHITTMLKRFQNQEYANLLVKVFNKSQDLFQKDDFEIKYTLKDVQTIFIDSIAENSCVIDDQFYEMIQKNKIGAQICKRKKNIRTKGITILHKKLIENRDNKEDFGDYVEMIQNNVESEEAEYLFEQKLYQQIKMYFNQNRQCKSFLQKNCKLIGTTCLHNKNFQNQYRLNSQLKDQLLLSELNTGLIHQILYALSQLVFKNEKNQRSIGNDKTVGFVVDTLKNHQQNQKIMMKCVKLLANLADDYVIIINLYIELKLHQILMKLLERYSDQNNYCDDNNYEILVNIIKLLKTLSFNIQASYLMLQKDYLVQFKKICDLAQQSQDLQIIKLNLEIFENILERTQISSDKVLTKMNEASIFLYLYDLSISNASNKDISLTVLGIYQKIMGVRQTGQIVMKNEKNVINVMDEIAKSQDANQQIYEKWSKLLYTLLILPQNTSIMLNSNLFYSAANFLKDIQSLPNQTLRVNLNIVSEMQKREDINKLKSVVGYLDLIIQLLKYGNLNNEGYIRIVDLLINILNMKQTNLNPYNSNKLFEAIIKKLQVESTNEFISHKSIFLLKKIKKHVELSGDYAKSMHEFASKVLTQTKLIEKKTYEEFSREVLCILSYFINFNKDIKHYFQEKQFLNILKNWCKIANALEYFKMPLTCRLNIYSIYNTDSFLLSQVEKITDKQVDSSKNILEKGFKCLLYRADGTNKSAYLRYDRNNNEILAYKLPDGEVKLKYRLNLLDIIVFKANYDKSQVIFKESRFPLDPPFFQSNVVPERCVTLIALKEDMLNIREISFQFEKNQLKPLFVQHFKILMSRQWLYNKNKEQ